MKQISTGLLILLLARGVPAQLQVVPEQHPQAVFGGMNQTIAVQFRNVGGQPLDSDLRLVLLQTSTATAARSGEWPWKKLLVLPGQTVLETATVPFPVVRAETQFLIQWVEGASNIVGRIEVLVYPTNLLAELAKLGDGAGALGLLDSNEELKPLLQRLKVEFVDLGEAALENFRGKLAIVGPFRSRAQMPADLPPRIEKLVRRGVGVVWLQPPPGPRDKLQPSFRTVPLGARVVVVVQSELVARLADSPQAQLNLLHFCRLAREPEPAGLPWAIQQPQEGNDYETK